MKKKKIDLPPVQTVLGPGERQRVRYHMTSFGGNIRRLCSRSNQLSPQAQQLVIQRLVIRPFNVIPTRMHSKNELVYFPQHGYAKIIIWKNGKPRAYNLNMGGGPIAIPAGHPYAIQTFATLTRIHVVAPMNYDNDTSWQTDAVKLCRNRAPSRL